MTSNIPQHIAVIMDGNGRWAQSRGLPRAAGHHAGVESVREIVRACGELGVEVLTLYAFSTENWARPMMEVQELMGLLCRALEKEILELDKNNVRLRFSGRWEGLSPSVCEALKRSIEKLEKNTGLILNLAVNYGSRQEILDAVNSILKEGADRVDESAFSNRLYTGGLPDPDLLIRTSGEMRLSNFLLWQCAYTEIHVTPVCWPDFRKKDLLLAVEDYQKRERRFGKVLSGN